MMRKRLLTFRLIISKNILFYNYFAKNENRERYLRHHKVNCGIID